ncbi:MAG: DegV family protein [Anaerolineales bacterium]|nr:DegV family protein [Anaerolineales bacterium]
MTGHEVALITDSTSDLPDDMLQEYDIGMVPLMVIWGNEELRDQIDIKSAEFYERLASDPIYPTTSQPSPAAFVQAVRDAKNNGAREAVIFTISSGMSSTYQSARQIENLVDIPVHIVDSKANSMSLGWQILAAARARNAGGSAAAMMAAADKVRENLVTLLYVNTLEYLHRGGRISGAARWAGTALQLKPQLFVDHKTGEIKLAARTRTRSKALEALYQRFFQQLDTSRPLHVAVMHGNIPDEAKAIAARIQREYTPVELVISLTSPVMGIHTGPGAIALCGYSLADNEA